MRFTYRWFLIREPQDAQLCCLLFVFTYLQRTDLHLGCQLSVINSNELAVRTEPLSPKEKQKRVRLREHSDWVFVHDLNSLTWLNSSQRHLYWHLNICHSSLGKRSWKEVKESILMPCCCITMIKPKNWADTGRNSKAKTCSHSTGDAIYLCLMFLKFNGLDIQCCLKGWLE